MLVTATIVLSASGALAATITVPLSAESWEFAPQKAEFIQHHGSPALKVLPGAGAVVTKALDFRDGTIEFDIEPNDPRFASFYFRWQSPDENECFYFRTARAGDLTAGDAVQYSPTLGGINLWDLLGHYQGNASFKKGSWNHVKLVVSGPQLRVYVNDMNRPTLSIPRLEGNVSHGGLAFEGEMIVTNLVVTPNAAEGIPSTAGIDPTDNDPLYLRHWQRSEPVVIPANIDFSYDLLPNTQTKWTPISAERRGLVNVTRLYGQANARRIIWLKTKLHAASAQTRRMALGFSDEVWVYINGRILHVDKNNYLLPIRKEPEGRCTTENTSFNLPLNAGDNELMIGVANDFYGWGIVAHMDTLAGITPEYR